MRLIDADSYIERQDECGWLDSITVEGFNEITPTIEAIPKDQYEARLKADMVAMLTEIQLEIEESCISKWRAEGIIQQKINKLKENKR